MDLSTNSGKHFNMKKIRCDKEEKPEPCHNILGRNSPSEKSFDLNLSQYLYDYHDELSQAQLSIPWYELKADKTWQPPCCAWLLKQKHVQSF